MQIFRLKFLQEFLFSLIVVFLYLSLSLAPQPCQPYQLILSTTSKTGDCLFVFLSVSLVVCGLYLGFSRHQPRLSGYLA